MVTDGSAGSSRAKGFWLVATIVTGTVLIAGCTATSLETADNQRTESLTKTITETATPPSSLDSTLYELVTSDNPKQYIKKHGLERKRDSVLVAIELQPEANPPETLIESIEVEQNDTVLAYVKIDNLLELAAHDAVSYVRPPERGAQHNSRSMQLSKSTDTGTAPEGTFAKENPY